MSEPTNAEEWLQLAKVEREAAAYMLDQPNLGQAVFAHIGFGIEYTLKAAIQKKFRYNKWPDKLRTHDHKKLLKELSVSVTPNHPIAPAWSIISQWRRSELYNPAGFSARTINDMFEAAFGEDGIEQWTHQTFL